MNFPTVAQVKAHIRVEIEDEEVSVYMRTKSHRRKVAVQFSIQV